MGECLDKMYSCVSRCAASRNYYKDDVSILTNTGVLNMFDFVFRIIWYVMIRSPRTFTTTHVHTTQSFRFATGEMSQITAPASKRPRRKCSCVAPKSTRSACRRHKRNSVYREFV